MNSNFSAAFTHRQQPLASSAESFFVLGEVEPNQMIDSSVLVRQLGRPPDHRFGRSGKTNGSGGHFERAFRMYGTTLHRRGSVKKRVGVFWSIRARKSATAHLTSGGRPMVSSSSFTRAINFGKRRTSACVLSSSRSAWAGFPP